MKRLFFIAVLMTAVVFTAYGKKSEIQTNAQVQALVERLNAQAAEKGNTKFAASVRGNDMVVTGEFNEVDGTTVKDIVNMIEEGGEVLYKWTINLMFGDMDEGSRSTFDILRENKANLIIHFIGKQSHEEAELVIRYEYFPGYTSTTNEIQNNSQLVKLSKMLNAEAGENPEFITSVRGNDFVITSEYDESDLSDGKTVKDIVNMIEEGGELMKKLVIYTILGDMDEGARILFDILRNNKANLIFHYIGKQSHEEAELVINYEDFPE